MTDSLNLTIKMFLDSSFYMNDIILLEGQEIVDEKRTFKFKNNEYQ